MRCKFCFATFVEEKANLPAKGLLPLTDARTIIEELAGIGFQKITFVGGEPMLYPWLPDLIALAKARSLTTMLVTNGTRLTPEWLEQHAMTLDWVTLSVDSLDEVTNQRSGRTMGDRVMTDSELTTIITAIHEYGYRFKLNTVVHQYNYKEDLRAFIQWAKPERWKVFQVLPIWGENDQHIGEMRISRDMFKHFTATHRCIDGLVIEDNDDMKGSYAMVDAAGRFFSNRTGTLVYGPSILEVGAASALSHMDYSFKKFVQRGGQYSW